MAAFEQVAKAMIQALPDSAANLRHDCWHAYTRAMAKAQAGAPHRMPWQDPQEVTEVRQPDGEATIAAIVAVLKTHGDRDLYELARRALVKAVEKFERHSSDSSKHQGKYERQCARPGCGMTFRTDQPSAKFHSDSCRQMAYRQAKRHKAARLSNAAAGQDQPRSGVHSPILGS